ncbi:hypothetical protein PIIN_02786 [Serendipita indica DSM 11827]|uniref:Methyltransferase domain-containing protein n=1 Tax=Serendipita indica (strain DSM 11827) TaxID=1109443 RepID=G4TCA1_SERID|nr:hypothetical protein PIIN_02786 [Serendipita indica DSM 11827]
MEPRHTSVQQRPGIRATIPVLRPTLDQAPFNLSPSEAATTTYTRSIADISVVTGESRGNENPTDGTSRVSSRVSRCTYRSDVDAARFIKHVGGRGYNTLNELYFLPWDNDEWGRLEHVTLALALGDLYPAAEEVRAVLAPVSGQTKKILDLGCGTGIWAIDMAHEFPHTEVVGVDLTPVPAELEAIPPNCRFEIDDINLGLNHFKDSFDVVHTRFVGTGLKNFRKTMDDVHQCLKPGGIAIWADADFDMCAEDWHIYQPFALDEDEDNPDQTDRSWSQRISYARQSDIDGMAKAMDEGLWLDGLMDPETCRTASLYLPVGT